MSHMPSLLGEVFPIKRTILAWTAFSLLAAACSVGSPQSPTAEAKTGGFTPRPLPTRMATPSATHSPSPEPLAPPTGKIIDSDDLTTAPLPPSATPTALVSALDETGPWIVICKRDGTTTFYNAAGGGLTPLRLRPCPMARSISPSGGLLAYPSTESDGTDHLKIMRLPDLSLTADIPLEGGELAEYDNGFELLWSPDARTLAFVVAQGAGGSTIILYDSRDGSHQQLADMPQDVHLLSWSPKGDAVVFLTGDGRLEAYWSASAATHKVLRLLDAPFKECCFYWGSVLGWISNTVFIAEDGPGESCSYYLRQIDIADGMPRILYQPAFQYASLDPASKTVFIGIPDSGVCAYTLSPGVYRSPLTNPTPRAVIQGSEWAEIRWHPEIGQFSISGRPGPALTTVSSSGQTRLTFSGADKLFPSPDGRWILAETVDPHGLDLYDGQGLRVTRPVETRPSKVVWFPDSSGFLALIETSLFRVMQSKGWMATPVIDDVYDVSLVKP